MNKAQQLKKENYVYRIRPRETQNMIHCECVTEIYFQ